MSTVADEITIAAPIERVWETIMDPGRLGDWVTIHKSVENFPRPPLRQGATMDQAMQVRGLTFPRALAAGGGCNEPHDARWEGGGPCPLRCALIRYRVVQ